MDIKEILEKQREFFHSGATLPVDFRLRALRMLYDAVESAEDEICRALASDLGKSDYESYMCEVGLALSEISYMIRHLRRFSREKTVLTPLAQFASRSYRKPAPYGNVLIMSPWNYPFLLTIEPLTDALAAGNTAVVKPSAYSPAVSAVIAGLVDRCFEPRYVAAVTGGRAENQTLLAQKFDMIFFTGSQSVGKEVLRQAAERLTPTVLELGGKSPCIVDSSAKLRLAARRITFGKFLNCGQTCVAPDYVLCHESVKDEFIAELVRQIRGQFGDSFANRDYGRIVNEKHFDRLLSLLPEAEAAETAAASAKTTTSAKIVCGGRSNRAALKLEPTVLDGVSWEDPVMQEEIFGPILPVLTYRDVEEVFTMLKDRPKPLALYVFSQNKALIRRATSRLSFGGGCVNDVVIHLATSRLPFGGVGESGMGAYHGEAGFQAFSHVKSIVDKKTWLDLPMRYQPYDRKLLRALVRFFLK